MNNIEQELKLLIANALKCNPSTIKPDSGLGKHYNWDSLGHVAIMVALEKKYGIEVNERNIDQLLSFAAIKKFISSYEK